MFWYLLYSILHCIVFVYFAELKDYPGVVGGERLFTAEQETAIEHGSGK